MVKDKNGKKKTRNRYKEFHHLHTLSLTIFIGIPLFFPNYQAQKERYEHG